MRVQIVLASASNGSCPSCGKPAGVRCRKLSCGSLSILATDSSNLRELLAVTLKPAQIKAVVAKLSSKDIRALEAAVPRMLDDDWPDFLNFDRDTWRTCERIDLDRKVAERLRDAIESVESA